MQKGARALSGGFQGPADQPPHHHTSSKSKSRRRSPRSSSPTHGSGRRSGEGSGSGSESSGSEGSSAGGCCRELDKGWDARRRDPRVNGADIYVARFTKNGTMGSAAPCWRCLEWCRWAGVKRIFHWNGDEARFDVVKVNNAQGAGMYETHADVRLFAGLVRSSLLSRTLY